MLALISLWLDSPVFWAPWHQSTSTYSLFSSYIWKTGGVWICKLAVISQERLTIKVKLLLSAIGSHVCHVDWHNRWPWVTMNDITCTTLCLCSSRASCYFYSNGCLHRYFHFYTNKLLLVFTVHWTSLFQWRCNETHSDSIDCWLDVLPSDQIKNKTKNNNINK